MSYAGTTAATPNPPVCVTGGIGIGRGSSALTGGNKNLWMYNSTNLTTDINASGFFADGYYLGMRPGDVVIGTQYTSAGSSVISFQGCIATVSTAGAASLSTGSVMTSTFG
jgi:hypothetical protein